MKKSLVASIICLLLFSLSITPATASNSGAHIFVDGVPLSSKAISKNGVSFVPFRELFEELKMGITYDATKGQVSGTKNNLKISFTLGSKTVYVNGEKKALQADPFTRNGTTFIPLRIVGEVTGNKVYWSSSANVVQINSPSFKGASYTVDGIPVLFSADGAISYGPSAEKGLKMQAELAEIEAIKKMQANSPTVSVSTGNTAPEPSDDPGYKGYPDYADPNYNAAVEKNEQLPPLMSDGWISFAMLNEIEGINHLGSDSPDTLRVGKYNPFAQYSIIVTDEYKKAKEGQFVLSDIRVKKYKGTMYLNIEDLKRVGLI